MMHTALNNRMFSFHKLFTAKEIDSFSVVKSFRRFVGMKSQIIWFYPLIPSIYSFRADVVRPVPEPVM